VQLFNPIAKEKNISLSYHVTPNVPSMLNIDPVRVRQCLSNLVSNAIKFTSVGSVMILVTSRAVGKNDHMLEIYVTDTGIDIPKDKQAHIFNTFQQADGSTAREFGGTGLGLSVSRTLARLMGGDITLSSEEGKGSVFTLKFMASAPAPLAGQGQPNLRPSVKVDQRVGPASAVSGDGAQTIAWVSSPAHPGARPSQVVSLTGKRVLIVDDNAINRLVLKALLKDHDIVSTEAVNGAEAVQLVADNEYDLVLLDIHMPIMNGVDAFRKMRSLTSRPMPRVIALTANAMKGDHEKYLDIGMDGYVAKPIDALELLTEINLVLQRHLLRDLAS
jgi:CheY-like chemotaxis protein